MGFVRELNPDYLREVVRTAEEIQAETRALLARARELRAEARRLRRRSPNSP